MPKPKTPTPAADLFDTDPELARLKADLHQRVLAARGKLASLERALAALTSTPDAMPHRVQKKQADADAVEQTRAKWRQEWRRKQRAKKKKAAPAKHRTLAPRIFDADGNRRVLRDFIYDALRAAPPEGLAVRDLTARVLAAGWPTTSKQPWTVVNQEMVSVRGKGRYRRDTDGRWTLTAKALAATA